MRVEIIVPLRRGCEYRDRAWAFVSERLRDTGHEVTIAPAPPGPWVKANAVNPAIRTSRADVLVVHDADVWAEGLEEAIEAVVEGAPWSMPHRAVFRLTERATTAYIDGSDFRALPLDRPAYLGMPGGGVVVASRTVLSDCPLDPRFVGWGQEDECWAEALRLLYGAPVRIPRPLIHLWHPPQERLSTRVGSLAGWHLRRRYFRVADDPVAMRRLIDEVNP